MDNNKPNKRKQTVREPMFTYDDYASIEDDKPYELVNGQLEMMSPSPTTIHQTVLFEIQKLLTFNCEANYFIYFAPIDVILSKTDVRQPDIVLVNRKRVDILSTRGIEGAPDLVVEILSPSSLKRDKIDKLKTYAHYGIPEYWIVEPKTGVLEQYFLHEERYEIIAIFQGGITITSPNIPCVSFTMREIMDNIPPLHNKTNTNGKE